MLAGRYGRACSRARALVVCGLALSLASCGSAQIAANGPFDNLTVMDDSWETGYGGRVTRVEKGQDPRTLLVHYSTPLTSCSGTVGYALEWTKKVLRVSVVYGQNGPCFMAEDPQSMEIALDRGIGGRKLRPGGTEQNGIVVSD
jgi:hypothetical protein